MEASEAGALSALILAGGQSRRMHLDKTRLVLEGMSLIQRVASAARSVADEILISADDAGRYAGWLEVEGTPIKSVVDRYPGAGPLAGLEAGLAAAKNDLLIALAADMPFVSPAVIRFLVQLAPGFDVVIPILGSDGTGPGGSEPLHAIYRRSCLAAVQVSLGAGRRQMISFLDKVRVLEVPAGEIRAVDPELRSFFNVNSPEDWTLAQRMVVG